jgi:hypothetical protein
MKRARSLACQPAPGILATLALDVEALGPTQRVYLLEQVKLKPFVLELGDALSPRSGE